MEENNLIFADTHQKNYKLEENYDQVSLKEAKGIILRISKNLSLFGANLEK